MSDVIVPDLDSDFSNYAHCQVSETLPIAPDSFFDWFMNEPPENLMLGTLLVSPMTGTEPLSEEGFGAPGTKRMFHFKDGTIAREVMLETDLPKRISYQPYGYNNPICFLSDHAKASMRVDPHKDGALITWDYAFHAKNKFALQLVKLFVSLDWKRNLRNALKVMKSKLEDMGVSEASA